MDALRAKESKENLGGFPHPAAKLPLCPVKRLNLTRPFR